MFDLFCMLMLCLRCLCSGMFILVRIAIYKKIERMHGCHTTFLNWHFRLAFVTFFNKKGNVR